MKICAIVLTKNEEKNIADCLETLLWCDEIIVVDDNSTDKTVKLAEKFGVKVFVRSLDNDFSKQRNFGLAKVNGDWVLFIDADERVSESLKNEIIGIILNPKDNEFSGYFLRRRDYIWGKELKFGETGNSKFLRLAKKQKGKWEGNVHEQWKIMGKTNSLRNLILHFPHPSIEEFMSDLNFYTDLKANELYKSKINVAFFSILLYPIGKFLSNFIVKIGFLDGMPGLVNALIMSFHSFLVRSKLWVLNQKK